MLFRSKGNMSVFMDDKIINKLKNMKGDVSFYYKNLVTQEIIKYNEEKPMLAASVIKLTVLVECFIMHKYIPFINSYNIILLHLSLLLHYY